MSQYLAVKGLADVITPLLSGADYARIKEFVSRFPINHPLGILGLEIHERACVIYPRFAALAERVDNGDDPEDREWIEAIDADRARGALEVKAPAMSELLPDGSRVERGAS